MSKVCKPLQTLTIPFTSVSENDTVSVKNMQIFALILPLIEKPYRSASETIGPSLGENMYTTCRSTMISYPIR